MFSGVHRSAGEQGEKLPSRRAGWRPVVAVAVIALGAGTAMACGDSEDSETKAAAPATKQAANVKKTGFAYWSSLGTKRIALVPFGARGGSVVAKPNGLIVEGIEHWYKPGTVVTVSAKSAKYAKFAGWGGGCTGDRPTCTLKMDDHIRLVAGFLDPRRPNE